MVTRLLLAALLVSAAACGPASTPAESESGSNSAANCAAKIAKGARHYELLRAQLNGEIIDLTGSGAGLSIGYDAPDAFGPLVGGFDHENLALYGAPGLVLMSGGWREESESRTGWYMGEVYGLSEMSADTTEIPAPASFSGCSIFTPPLTTSFDLDSEALAALGDQHRVFASFLFVQTGNPYIEIDAFNGTTALYWGDVSFLLAERAESVFTD